MNTRHKRAKAYVAEFQWMYYASTHEHIRFHVKQFFIQSSLRENYSIYKNFQNKITR